MEHEFAFVAALHPHSRRLLEIAAESLRWDVESLAVVITPGNEHFQRAIELHFSDLAQELLPWPWQIAIAAE